nr:hypothetical protein Iba_chr04cCG16710 [Ipomoea batatas]
MTHEDGLHFEPWSKLRRMKLNFDFEEFHRKICILESRCSFINHESRRPDSAADEAILADANATSTNRSEATADVANVQLPQPPFLCPTRNPTPPPKPQPPFFRRSYLGTTGTENFVDMSETVACSWVEHGNDPWPKWFRARLC